MTIRDSRSLQMTESQPQFLTRDVHSCHPKLVTPLRQIRRADRDAFAYSTMNEATTHLSILVLLTFAVAE